MLPLEPMGLKLQIGSDASFTRAELGRQERTCPALGCPGNLHSIPIRLRQPSARPPAQRGRHCTHREVGGDALILGTCGEHRSARLANSLCKEGCSASTPCLGSDWPPLHFPDSGAFIFDAVGMNYVHTPLNTDLMRGFLFLLLALAFNGF